MAAIAAVSLAPIGSKAFRRILKQPYLRDCLIGIWIERQQSEIDWRVNASELQTKQLYTLDYGLRMVVASNGVKAPDGWLVDSIFKPKTSDSYLDRELIKNFIF